VEEIIRNHPELVIWVTLIGSIAICYIVKIGGGHWRAVRQAELDADLKEQMVQRGMSAAEIVQALQAGKDHAPEIEIEKTPAYAQRRYCGSSKGWLWLAIGVPVVMFVLCSGMIVGLLSVSVSASNSVIGESIGSDVAPMPPADRVPDPADRW
jgi:hypothetical protein